MRVPQIHPSALVACGAGLVGPECVIANSDCTLYASDQRGGVSVIRPDGKQHLIAGSSADLRRDLAPNGISREPDGSFLVAHLAEDEGGVFRLSPSGVLTPFLRAVDRIDLPPTNYVNRDPEGRVWITVSTDKVPRSLDYGAHARSGYIIVIDGKGPRVVLDGLGYVNECGVSPDGQWLYFNETFARQLSRCRLNPNNTLGSKEVVHHFGRGDPDGLAFDDKGGIWVACIFGNRVLRVLPGSGAQCIIDGGSPDFVETIETILSSRPLTRSEMKMDPLSALGNVSSVTFGGPGRRTLFLGSLRGGTILATPVSTPGRPRC